MSGRSICERPCASHRPEGLRPIVAVLDVGASKTTVVAGRLNDSGRLDILGFGESAGILMQHGVLLNIDESVSSVRLALEDCLDSNPSLRIEEVFVGVSGIHTRCLQTHCDVMRRDTDVGIRQDELDSLIADQYRTRLPGGSGVIEVIPRSFSVDSLQNIPNPVGYSGAKIGADFHVIIGEKDPMYLLKRCVERAGLKVAAFSLKPLASANAVLCEDDLEAGVAMLDIGGGTSGLSVFCNGTLQHVSVIPFGGENVTSDIKRGLGLLRRDAEQLKLLHGCAIDDKKIGDAYISLVGNRGLPGREIGVDTLSRIIQARMSELLECVILNLGKAGIDRRLLNGGIVLTGGGSKLKNLLPLTEYVTGLNARIGHPGLHLSASHPDGFADPANSTCLGLLLRGVGKNLGFPILQKKDTESRRPDKGCSPETTDASKSPRESIKVLGVGGVGINVLSRMHAQPIDGVGLAICDRDERALAGSEVAEKLRLCPEQPGKPGSCIYADKGCRPLECIDRGFRDVLREETGMLFVMAGMGGGTGTSSAPILARLASEMGVPTIGIVATPFPYEGKGRARHAHEGIQALGSNVDALLVIDNRMLGRMNCHLTAKEAATASESAMASSARCLISAFQSTGRMNPDFKGIRSNFAKSGMAFLGSASAVGQDRARTALQKALEVPLAEGVSFSGVEWVLVNVESAEGENECRMGELDLIQSKLLEITGPDTDVILGHSLNSGLSDSIAITMLASASSHGAVLAKQKNEGFIGGKDEAVPALTSVGSEAGSQSKPSANRLFLPNPDTAPFRTQAEGSVRFQTSMNGASTLTGDEANSAVAFKHSNPMDFGYELEQPLEPGSLVSCSTHAPACADDPFPNPDSSIVNSEIYAEKEPVDTSSLGMSGSSESTSMREQTEARKREEAELWQRVRDQSPNLDASCPINHFDRVPAYVRCDFESHGSSSPTAQKFYSSISLLFDENAGQACLSSLNSFLDGKRPD